MKARAGVELPGRISDAEALWYDLRRWPSFVDGFGNVQKVEGEWPGTGARLLWTSQPGGRGLVSERVVAYAVRAGQTVEVEDPRIRGRQVVTFTPGRLELELEFALKQGGRLAAPFVRRAFRDSLQRTLARFAHELRGDLELAGGGA